MSSGKKIHPDKVTPEAMFLNRRNFIRAGLLAGSAALTSLAYRSFSPGMRVSQPAPMSEGADQIEKVERTTNFSVDEPTNSLEDITHYNNFYEFSTTKTAVAAR